MTYLEFIHRSVEQAQRGIDPNRSKLMDAEGIAQIMAPQVFAEIGSRAARDEKLRSILTSPFTVAFVNGLATLGDTVLTAYLCESTLIDVADVTKRYSFIQNWGDFVRPRSAIDQRFGWFAMQGGTQVAVLEPNASYAVGTGVTGNRNLTAPRIPGVPATAATELDAPSEIEDDLINALAEMVRGKLIQEAA
jgi:hypothetical protein